MKPTVESILGKGGALSAALPGYEARPSQLRLAQQIDRAVRGHHHLMAEAGTGTGKTLAYLVPAALSGRRVVISTATKTLQEQLFFKDIPLLRDAVGLSFDAAYLKGRANYLCAHRFEKFDQAPTFEPREEADGWASLRQWALRTQSGDRAEADLPETFRTWSSLSATSDSCLGKTCALYEPCFVTQARRKAELASVVVVNHHLFFADLALRTRPGAREAGLGVLPPYDVVVFDEAHALEDIATDFFGVQVSSFRIEDLVADALGLLAPTDPRAGMISALALALQHRAAAFFEAARPLLGLDRAQSSARLSSTTYARLQGRLDEVLEALTSLRALTASEDEPALVALRRRSAELAVELDFVYRADSPDHVYWAEQRGRGIVLRASPIDLGDILRKTLYSAIDTVVFTSATLTAQGRFDYFAGRMGLSNGVEEPSASEVSVGSPFDFSTQAALYVPTHLPEPNAPGFLEAACEELLALAQVTSGRAFFLFTSKRNMEAAHALLKDRLPCPALLQGERPKRALLEAFAQSPTVLFATHTFWEGVDVPGPALSLVVIDRLPFASPGDPRVAARIEQLQARGENPFTGYQLPEAAICLRQGFGRLIRSKDDRGIVAVLDRRLATRPYGRAFLQSLPPARRVESVEGLKQWF